MATVKTSGSFTKVKEGLCIYTARRMLFIWSFMTLLPTRRTFQRLPLKRILLLLDNLPRNLSLVSIVLLL